VGDGVVQRRQRGQEQEKGGSTQQSPRSYAVEGA
jgi:hypothetical protein